jgi:uncharacterized protein (TIGR03067 family)
MKYSPIWLRGLQLLLLLNILTLPLLAAEDRLKDDLAKLQGKWTATVTTEQGSSVWTMEVKDNKSTIVMTTKTGEEFFKGKCGFKLEQHGSFKAFTYSNLKNLTGGRERATPLTDGKTKSSIYKLDADTFITTGGFRTDDEDKPMLIKWEKVLETKK